MAFADHMGRVLVSRRAVGPRERVRCVSAKVAIERLASTDPWFEVGDNVFADIERKI